MRSSLHPIRHDVFISYRLAYSFDMRLCSCLTQYLCSNSHDLPHAELLYSKLQAQGLNTFFDAMCLRLDEPWEPQITAALSSSLVIVLLVSHASIEGGQHISIILLYVCILLVSCVRSANESSYSHASSTRLLASRATYSVRASCALLPHSHSRLYWSRKDRRITYSSFITPAPCQFLPRFFNDIV